MAATHRSFVEGPPDLEIQPGLLTGCLLQAANGSHLSCFSQIVLLNVVRLRLRRPICENPNI